MLARYTGRDGDLGLKTGKVYDIIATNKYSKKFNICIDIYNGTESKPRFCCYDSLEGLFMNWHFAYPQSDCFDDDAWSDF